MASYGPVGVDLFCTAVCSPMREARLTGAPPYLKDHYSDVAVMLTSISNLTGLSLSLGSARLADMWTAAGVSVPATWDAAVPAWPLCVSRRFDAMVGWVLGMSWLWLGQSVPKFLNGHKIT